MSLAVVLILCFTASIFPFSRPLLLPPRPAPDPEIQPAANSGPSDVSAVKVCLVPRFDWKRNPGRSSFRMVACCCPSEFMMLSSPSCKGCIFVH